VNLPTLLFILFIGAAIAGGIAIFVMYLRRSKQMLDIGSFCAANSMVFRPEPVWTKVERADWNFESEELGAVGYFKAVDASQPVETLKQKNEKSYKTSLTKILERVDQRIVVNGVEWETVVYRVAQGKNLTWVELLAFCVKGQACLSIKAEGIDKISGTATVAAVTSNLGRYLDCFAVN
jgi:hypothetical protein